MSNCCMDTLLVSYLIEVVGGYVLTTSSRDNVRHSPTKRIERQARNVSGLADQGQSEEGLKQQINEPAGAIQRRNDLNADKVPTEIDRMSVTFLFCYFILRFT